MSRFVLIVFAGVAMAAVVAAQGPSNADPIRELLVEVRALRVALERTAQMGPRIQVLVARVQMHEQRIIDLSRRIATVRSTIRDVDKEVQLTTASIQELESHFRRVTDANERQALDDRIESLKTRAQGAVTQRQELTTEEGLLAQQLAGEESRLSAVSERLEQLERTLAQPNR